MLLLHKRVGPSTFKGNDRIPYTGTLVPIHRGFDMDVPNPRKRSIAGVREVFLASKPKWSIVLLNLTVAGPVTSVFMNSFALIIDDTCKIQGIRDLM